MTFSHYPRITAPNHDAFVTDASRQLGALVADELILSLMGPSARLVSHSGTSARIAVADRQLEIHVVLTPHLPGKGDNIERPGSHLASHYLFTDFDQYAVAVADRPNGPITVRWRGSSSSLESVLRLSGGVLRFAEDSDWALISRSVAIDLPSGSRFTSGQYRTDKTSRGPQRLTALAAPGFKLRDIYSVWSEFFPDTQAPEEERKEGSRVTRLRALAPVLSDAVAFVGETALPNRGDYVSSYYSRTTGETFREFVVDQVEAQGEYSGPLRELQFNVLHLLAVRRTKLFRAKYAARVYTVALPPGLLADAHGATIALIPVVTATRLPNAKRFRATIGLTLIAVPVTLGSDGSMVARKPGHSEVAWLTDDLRAAGGLTPQNGDRKLEGPLMRYLDQRAEDWSLAGVFRAVTIKVSEQATGGHLKQSTARARALSGLRQSTMGSVCYLVDWQSDEGPPWGNWSAGGEDGALRELLHRAVFRSDHTAGADASSTSATVDFRGLSIGNAHGTDMMGMTIFNPQDDTKYVLFPIAAEQYPNNSVLRWMTWQVYLDVAVAAVRSLLGRFHDGVDTASDLRRVLRSVQRLTAELAEVYDLDLSDFYYRREFEMLRRVTHLDADYVYMRQRLEGAQGEASLREQMLMNNLVLALTISGVASAVIVAIGDSANWSVLGYVAATCAALTASLVISFGLFEPLRRTISRLRSAVAARRR